MTVLRYDLDSLGWLEFEHLIQALLKSKFGFGIEAWGGSGDWGKDASFTGSLNYPSNEPATGSFVFQCKFVENANAAGSTSEKLLLSAVAAETKKIVARLRPVTYVQRVSPPKWTREPGYFILLTNAPVPPALRLAITATIAQALPKSNVHIHSGTDVCAWLDASPKIARQFPQLLGLRDLETLLREYLNRGVSHRSSTALANAKDVAQVFVPTKAYSEALAKLAKRHFVVLEGPPEMGKSAIGRMIALTNAARGWEALEIQHPEEFLQLFDKESHQVFVADDFFGRTEYDAQRTSKWEQELPYILPNLGPKCWLILTSRAHLLNIAKKNLDVAGANHVFPDLGEVVVDAGRLTQLEKARIVYRHCKHAGFPQPIVSAIKKFARVIVGNRHFTPERIRRLVAEVLPGIDGVDDNVIRMKISESLANPTKGMGVSFAKLSPSQQWLLYSLVEQNAPGLTTRFDQEKEQLQQRYERLCPIDVRNPYAAVLSEMTEAFITVKRFFGGYESIDWIHPSCRDLAIDKLSADVFARRNFLKKCDKRGLHLAVSLGGGSEGNRSYPLLQDEQDWSTVADRFLEQGVDDFATLRFLVANRRTAGTVNLASSLLEKFDRFLLRPLFNLSILSLSEVVDVSEGDITLFDSASLALNERFPVEEFLTFYRRKVSSLPPADASYPYWRDEATAQFLSYDNELNKVELVRCDGRYLELQSNAIGRMLELAHYWVKEQVEPLRPEDPDFSAALKGCDALDSTLSTLIATVQLDQTSINALKRRKIKVRRVAETMRELRDQEGQDEDPNEEDRDDGRLESSRDSDVDIGNLFRDL